ncbi:MAG: flagellar basal body rod C-terminal domain-containing protein [Chitinispirillaceae bacterium]
MNTSFNTSAFGLRAAQTNLDNTAHSIANVNTAEFTPRKLHQSETIPPGTRISAAKPGSQDLTRDMTDLTVSKNAYTANLKVIKLQDNMLGELIDLTG